MAEALLTSVKKAKVGRPASPPLDPGACAGIPMDPGSAREWFDLCDRLLSLDAKGHSQADISRVLDVSPATISRLQKAARWPKNIRARILLASDRFPPRVLMRLARTTFKDQGSISRRGQRQIKRSRITLLSAVELIIEGNAPPEPKELALAQAKRLEALALEERARRQELQKKCEDLSEENEKLKEALSIDRLSSLLRENRALKAELHRLRTQGKGPASQRRSADLVYRDDFLGSRLRCEAETIDWARGLLVLNFRSGELLDGFIEKMAELSSRI